MLRNKGKVSKEIHLTSALKRRF